MSKGQNDSTVHRSHVSLISPANMKQLSFTVSKYWAHTIFKIMVILLICIKSKGQNNHAVHKSHAWLLCPENKKQLPSIISEHWPGQRFHGGHIFKVEGQIVKITWQCTSSMQDWLPENMKQLSCIVSEYWPGHGLDNQISVKGHNFKDKGKNGSTMHKSHIRLICLENMKKLVIVIYIFIAMDHTGFSR